jgi:hypothetical protein
MISQKTTDILLVGGFAVLLFVLYKSVLGRNIEQE